MRTVAERAYAALNIRGDAVQKRLNSAGVHEAEAPPSTGTTGDAEAADHLSLDTNAPPEKVVYTIPARTASAQQTDMRSFLMRYHSPVRSKDLRQSQGMTLQKFPAREYVESVIESAQRNLSQGNNVEQSKRLIGMMGRLIDEDPQRLQSDAVLREWVG